MNVWPHPIFVLHFDGTGRAPSRVLGVMVPMALGEENSRLSPPPRPQHQSGWGWLHSPVTHCPCHTQSYCRTLSYFHTLPLSHRVMLSHTVILSHLALVTNSHIVTPCPCHTQSYCHTLPLSHTVMLSHLIILSHLSLVTHSHIGHFVTQATCHTGILSHTAYHLVIQSSCHTVMSSYSHVWRIILSHSFSLVLVKQSSCLVRHSYIVISSNSGFVCLILPPSVTSRGGAEQQSIRASITMGG